MPTTFLFHPHFIQGTHFYFHPLFCLFIFNCWWWVAVAGFPSVLWQHAHCVGSLLRLNVSFVGKMRLLRETTLEICIMSKTPSIIWSAAASKTVNNVPDSCLHSRFISGPTDKGLLSYFPACTIFFFFFSEGNGHFISAPPSQPLEMFSFPLII